jgi:perosamine synthetase
MNSVNALPYWSNRPEKTILTAGPSITEKEISYVTDAVTNGWNQHWGDYIAKFEKAFAEYVGTKHALATSSCTGALHLILAALGLKEGDEVIVPEITWIATASAACYLGAKPVFVDVEEDTWCMCPRSLERAITPRTKVIMPVHIYGHPANMDEISAIAARHGIDIVEDAAPSLGANIRGKRTGSFGRAAAFSFQGAKIMVTGEGGMLVTDDTDLFERIKGLWDHGRDPHKTFWNSSIGYKYKMSNIQAALGLAQLERIEELVEKKRQIYRWYAEGLEGCPHVRLNAERAGYRNIMWMSSLILAESSPLSREELMKKLKEANVDSRPFFYPMSVFPMFETADTPTAAKVSQGGINLPSGHNLNREQVDYVCDVIRGHLGAAARGTRKAA